MASFEQSGVPPDIQEFQSLFQVYDQKLYYSAYCFALHVTDQTGNSLLNPSSSLSTKNSPAGANPGTTTSISSSKDDSNPSGNWNKYWIEIRGSRIFFWRVPVPFQPSLLPTTHADQSIQKIMESQLNPSFEMIEEIKAFKKDGGVSQTPFSFDITYAISSIIRDYRNANMHTNIPLPPVPYTYFASLSSSGLSLIHLANYSWAANNALISAVRCSAFEYAKINSFFTLRLLYRPRYVSIFKDIGIQLGPKTQRLKGEILLKGQMRILHPYLLDWKPYFVVVTSPETQQSSKRGLRKKLFSFFKVGDKKKKKKNQADSQANDENEKDMAFISFYKDEISFTEDKSPLFVMKNVHSAYAIYPTSPSDIDRGQALVFEICGSFALMSVKLGQSSSSLNLSRSSSADMIVQSLLTEPGSFTIDNMLRNGMTAVEGSPRCLPTAITFEAATPFIAVQWISAIYGAFELPSELRNAEDELVKLKLARYQNVRADDTSHSIPGSAVAHLLRGHQTLVFTSTPPHILNNLYLSRNEFCGFDHDGQSQLDALDFYVKELQSKLNSFERNQVDAWHNLFQREATVRSRNEREDISKRLGKVLEMMSRLSIEMNSAPSSPSRSKTAPPSYRNTASSVALASHAKVDLIAPPSSSSEIRNSAVGNAAGNRSSVFLDFSYAYAAGDAAVASVGSFSPSSVSGQILSPVALSTSAGGMKSSLPNVPEERFSRPPLSPTRVSKIPSYPAINTSTSKSSKFSFDAPSSSTKSREWGVSSVANDTIQLHQSAERLLQDIPSLLGDENQDAKEDNSTDEDAPLVTQYANPATSARNVPQVPGQYVYYRTLPDPPLAQTASPINSPHRQFISSEASSPTKSPILQHNFRSNLSHNPSLVAVKSFRLDSQPISPQTTLNSREPDYSESSSNNFASSKASMVAMKSPVRQDSQGVESNHSQVALKSYWLDTSPTSSPESEVLDKKHVSAKVKRIPNVLDATSPSTAHHESVDVLSDLKPKRTPSIIKSSMLDHQFSFENPAGLAGSAEQFTLASETFTAELPKPVSPMKPGTPSSRRSSASSPTRPLLHLNTIKADATPLVEAVLSAGDSVGSHESLPSPSSLNKVTSPSSSKSPTNNQRRNSPASVKSPLPKVSPRSRKSIVSSPTQAPRSTMSPPAAAVVMGLTAAEEEEDDKPIELFVSNSLLARPEEVKRREGPLVDLNEKPKFIDDANTSAPKKDAGKEKEEVEEPLIKVGYMAEIARREAVKEHARSIVGPLVDISTIELVKPTVHLGLVGQVEQKDDMVKEVNSDGPLLNVDAPATDTQKFDFGFMGKLYGEDNELLKAPEPTEGPLVGQVNPEGDNKPQLTTGYVGELSKLEEDEENKSVSTVDGPLLGPTLAQPPKPEPEVGLMAEISRRQAEDDARKARIGMRSNLVNLPSSETALPPSMPPPGHPGFIPPAQMAGYYPYPGMYGPSPGPPYPYGGQPCPMPYGAPPMYYHPPYPHSVYVPSEYGADPTPQDPELMRLRNQYLEMERQKERQKLMEFQQGSQRYSTSNSTGGYGLPSRKKESSSGTEEDSDEETDSEEDVALGSKVNVPISRLPPASMSRSSQIEQQRTMAPSTKGSSMGSPPSRTAMIVPTGNQYPGYYPPYGYPYGMMPHGGPPSVAASTRSSMMSYAGQPMMYPGMPPYPMHSYASSIPNAPNVVSPTNNASPPSNRTNVIQPSYLAEGPNRVSQSPSPASRLESPQKKRVPVKINPDDSDAGSESGDDVPIYQERKSRRNKARGGANSRGGR